MDLTTTAAFVTEHWPLVTAAVFPIFGAFHSRLGKYPVAKVLSRYVGVLPVLRIAALELAQAVIDQFGPLNETAQLNKTTEQPAPPVAPSQGAGR